MIASPHRTRVITVIGLVIVLAAMAVPAAQAADKPDTVDRYLHNNAPVDLRSPDRKFPARQWAYPDAVDRALANGYGIAPDAIDRYLMNNGGATPPVDYRSPDTRDAVVGRYPTSSPVFAAAPAEGFDWSDGGIGAGTMLGLMLLLLASRRMLVHRESEPSSESASVLSS